MARERILFVTGRFAESSLRRVLSELGPGAAFDYEVAVLGISVAALMHADWVSRKLDVPGDFDRIIVPGWCHGDLDVLSRRHQTPFELGPKDLFDLPEHLSGQGRQLPALDQYDIEILAEINHALRLTDTEILQEAERYRESGADVIDLGCLPGETWNRAGPVTAMLKAEGFRVSIDSFDSREVEDSVAAGAELVLSCNSQNVDWLAGLDVEVVAIPDDPHDLSTLDRTVETLLANNASFRVDPILEPIGFGFAASLERYFRVRRKWPDLPMMMGVGNLTELTEVDSAGINVLLAAICQELSIHSVLTTEVINWGRTAVREFDFARKLMYHSVNQQVLPKHLDPQLVLLRDPKVREMGAEELQTLASQLSDPNFRVFAESGELHLMNRDGYWQGTDPFELFDRVLAETGGMDAAHAFYLGYELSKAATALTLGKQYRQDQALTWGFLTVPETSAVERRHQQRRQGGG